MFFLLVATSPFVVRLFIVVSEFLRAAAEEELIMRVGSTRKFQGDFMILCYANDF